MKELVIGKTKYCVRTLQMDSHGAMYLKYDNAWTAELRTEPVDGDGQTHSLGKVERIHIEQIQDL